MTIGRRRSCSSTATIEPRAFTASRRLKKRSKLWCSNGGQRPPRTHNLVTLMDLARQAGFAIAMPVDELVFLNYVSRGRYPSEAGLLPHGEPTRGPARRAVRAATTWLGDVRRTLGEADLAPRVDQHPDQGVTETPPDSDAADDDVDR